VSFLLYVVGLVLIAVVAWGVASPLFAPPLLPLPEPESPREERWRKQKEEALAAIKEAEFDFHLGELSDQEYRRLRARLEAQALEAMGVLERRGNGDVG
jgi:hypothetical protein